MEAQEEVIIMGSSSSKDQQTHIVKGKRTKRQRPQSPIPFAVMTSSSSGDNDINITANNSSPATSFIDSTEEEEDMANCLILLAQSGGSSLSPPPPPVENIIPLRQIEDDVGILKFDSRRYQHLQQTDATAAATVGKASGGFCVYECKTCSRTFPSFQALGGHRASHKKLKLMAEEKNIIKHFNILSDDEGVVLRNNISINNLSPLSLQLGNNIRGNLNSTSNNKSKVHECSVCGAEFTSGQALGGHMRRHRGPNMTSSTTNTSLSLTPLALEKDEAKKPRNILSLDLNLPAPEDDHQRESKFPFAASKAPALVDCHY